MKKIFVIHKHFSKRLHWDLRLEMQGVLKSWAVPKEPPTKKGIKRLAIQVVDHNLDYADFEGIIPEGQYGAGKVEIWDKGAYEIESENKKKIVLVFYGKKLKERYCLLRFRDDWLFFKL